MCRISDTLVLRDGTLTCSSSEAEAWAARLCSYGAGEGVFGKTSFVHFAGLLWTFVMAL